MIRTARCRVDSRPGTGGRHPARWAQHGRDRGPSGWNDWRVVWTCGTSPAVRPGTGQERVRGTASHELRSPLTSIKGFVELLERKVPTPCRPAAGVRRDHRPFHRRLVDLVNDLLDVARIEADHVAIRRRPIDIGVAVRELAELMGPDRRQAQHLGFLHRPDAAAGAGRSGAHSSGHRQPAHKRPSVHPGGRSDPRRRRSRPGLGPDRRRRLRHRHVGGRARARIERFYVARSGTESTRGRAGPVDRQVAVDLHHGELHWSQIRAGYHFHVLIPAAVLPDSGTQSAGSTAAGCWWSTTSPDVAGLIAELSRATGHRHGHRHQRWEALHACGNSGSTP